MPCSRTERQLIALTGRVPREAATTEHPRGVLPRQGPGGSYSQTSAEHGGTGAEQGQVGGEEHSHRPWLEMSPRLAVTKWTRDVILESRDTRG